MYDNAAFGDSFLLLDPAGQVAEFPLQRPAAAAATGQIKRAIIFIIGIAGKAPRTIMECFLAVVAGTAFLDDVTLYDNDVFLVFKIDHPMFP